MDTFVFYCPHCKQKIEADELLRGKIVKCPCCKEEIVIDIECFWEEDNNGEYNISNEDNNKATIDDNNLENNDIEDDENNISLEDNLDNNNDEIDPHKQCKLCRGKLDIDDGTYVYVCPNCAKLITFPLYRDEKIAELYTTAENFCQEKEYGKAYSVYEMIISETPDDPAAYWGMLLSKFGVEYVKIPESETYVPYYSLKTDECILNDITFLTILDIAEPDIAKLYQSEALRIIPNQNAVKKQKELKLKEQYNHLLEHLNLEFKLNDNPELLASLRKNINETKKALKKVKTLDETELEAIIECNIQVLKYSGNLDEKIERIRIKRENLRKKTIKATKLLFTVLAVLVICYYTIQAGSYAVSKYSLWSGNVCLTKDGVIVGFKYDKNLIKNCVIPDNVTKITSNTFKGCSKLQKLEIPASVKEIEENAFENCTALKNISLPNGITKIKAGTFRGCSSLQKLIIPASVKEIEENAFENCYALKNISLPNGISKIAAATFKGCSSLEELIIPATVTEIEEKAFKNCSALRKISLPKGISKIAASTFRGCSNLQELIIPPNVKVIEESAFENCSALREISLPNGITKIKSSYFKGCYSLQELTIPSTVTEIEEKAFEYCVALKKISLPNGISKIKSSYFKGSSSLEELIIPSTVTEIEEGAFENCSNLKKISLPKGISKIAASTFRGCKNLQELSIPSTVTEIEESAFENCSRLWEFSLPKGISKIAASTFRGCSSLRKLTIPSTVTEIEEGAFENCKNLRTLLSLDSQYEKKHSYSRHVLSGLVIPYSVKKIGERAFYDCGTMKTSYGRMAGKYVVAIDCKIENYPFYFSDIVTRISSQGKEYSIYPLEGNLNNQTKTFPFPENCGSNKFHIAGDERLKSCTIIYLSQTGAKYFIDAEKGDAKSQYLLGYDCLKNNYLEGAKKWLKKSAENNYAPAQKLLSQLKDKEMKSKKHSSLGLGFSKNSSTLKTLNNKKITAIKIPPEVRQIKQGTFKKCNPSLVVTISKNITSIEEAAFTGVKKVISENELFPVDENGVLIDKKNKKLLFAPPTLQKEYKIPKTVTKIGKEAFFNCSLLKEITIPPQITSIGYAAFAGINKVISNNETFIVDENGALLDKKRKELLYVPPTLKEEYKIPHIVRHIGHKAFFNCSLLKEIIIPGSIKFVNIEEFNSCKNLKTLILQNGVKYFNTFSFNVTPLNIEFMDLPPSITEVNFSRRFSSFLPKLKRIRLSKQTKVSGKTPKVLSFYD